MHLERGKIIRNFSEYTRRRENKQGNEVRHVQICRVDVSKAALEGGHM